MKQAQSVVEGIKECVTIFISNNKDELKGVTTIPVVFCGDFNAQPDTPTYKWMHDNKSVYSGTLDSFGRSQTFAVISSSAHFILIFLWCMSMAEAIMMAQGRSAAASSDPFQMTSSFRAVYGSEPECTFRTSSLAHCVDYIWWCCFFMSLHQMNPVIDSCVM
jgi:hypothetical protein